VGRSRGRRAAEGLAIAPELSEGGVDAGALLWLAGGGLAAGSVLEESFFAQAVSSSAAASAVRATLVFIDRYPDALLERANTGELSERLFYRSASPSRVARPNFIGSPYDFKQLGHFLSLPNDRNSSNGSPAAPPRPPSPHRHTIGGPSHRSVQDDPRWCPYRAPVARCSIPRAPRRHLSAHRASAGGLRVHGPSRAFRLAGAGLPGRPDLRLQGSRPLQGLGSTPRCTRLLPLFRAGAPPFAGFP